MFYTVYKITNNVNGKIYIGVHKTKDLDDGYMGSGILIRKAQEKYGIENFTKEYLSVFDNPDDMFQMESELVNSVFVTSDKTYNLKEGGFGGWEYVQTILTKEKRSEISSLGGNAARDSILKKYGVKSTASLPEVKEKISAGLKKYFKDNEPAKSFLGKTHTDETKRKISIANSKNQIGEKNSNYGKMWIYSDVEKKSISISKHAPIPEGWIKGRKFFK